MGDGTGPGAPLHNARVIQVWWKCNHGTSEWMRACSLWLRPVGALREERAGVGEEYMQTEICGISRSASRSGGGGRSREDGSRFGECSAMRPARGSFNSRCSLAGDRLTGQVPACQKEWLFLDDLPPDLRWGVADTLQPKTSRIVYSIYEGFARGVVAIRIACSCR
jgi:hypothetical protein